VIATPRIVLGVSFITTLILFPEYGPVKRRKFH
jgi:hypothetical protein